jgi:hypothetical protein
MRKTSLLFAGAGVVLLAACSGDKKSAMNDDLKNALELASSTDGITLANSAGNMDMQVVSAIERTAPPARRQTPSTRVKRHRAAPKAPPQVVQTEALASVSESEMQSVAPEPVANDPMPVSPRPQPVAVSYPSGPSSGGDDGRVSEGSTAGVIIGSVLGAVIRGGTVGGGGIGGVDRCDPRTDGRRSGGRISINNRLPFPVSGRIGGISRPSAGSGTGNPMGRIARR